MTPFHFPPSFRIPISKWGAVSRLILGMVITFMAAVQLAHTTGKPIDFWVIFGAVLLSLKDAQSFINQAWGQAFLTSPAATLTPPPAGSVPPASLLSKTAGGTPQ